MLRPDRRKSARPFASSTRPSRPPTGSTRGRPRDARLRQLGLAPPLRPAGQGTPEAAAPELVDVHRDVDVACATLSAAWPRPHLAPSQTSSRPASGASSAGSTPGGSPTPRTRTSRTRATTSGACSTTAASRRGSSTRSSSSSCSPLGYGVTNAAYRTTPGSGDLRRGDFDAGAARAGRAGAPAARDRLRRQGGLPRRLRRAPRARPAGADARLDRSLRPAVDLTGERRRPVRRAPALVPRAPRLARAGAAHGGARARRRRRRPRAAPALREPGHPRRVVGDAGRRDRARRERGAGLPPRARSRRSASRGTTPGRPSGSARTSSRGTAACTASSSASTSSGSSATRSTPTIDLVPEGVYGHRWWTLDELEATSERLAPRCLATQLRELLEHGPPPAPIDVT